MQQQRWWSVAVVGTAAVLASVLVLSSPQLWQLNLGLGSIAVFLAFWFALGTRVSAGTRGANVVAVVTVLFAGAVTLADPNLAVVQCIAFPLVWTRLESIPRSIVASCAIAIACALGLFFTSGLLLQAFVVEALSLVFSIALGLWISGIATQSFKRQSLIDELQATQGQVAMLSQDAGIASERERLAREIHDTIAQDLTGLVLLAQSAGRELNAGDTAAASEKLTLLEEGARTALAETRALVASTSPAGLDVGGIAAALDRLAQRYEREAAITVTMRADVETALNRDLEVVLLRCAQEGLANVRKHSGASRAAITLVATPSELSLRVSDNGSGFDPADVRHGYGLSGMRERLALVGGTLDLESGEEGTTLLVTLPREGTA
jgi:signal transduction histidine kinase